VRPIDVHTKVATVRRIDEHRERLPHEVLGGDVQQRGRPAIRLANGSGGVGEDVALSRELEQLAEADALGLDERTSLLELRGLAAELLVGRVQLLHESLEL
jgi:hypothetical protein